MRMENGIELWCFIVIFLSRQNFHTKIWKSGIQTLGHMVTDNQIIECEIKLYNVDKIQTIIGFKFKFFFKKKENKFK